MDLVSGLTKIIDLLVKLREDRAASSKERFEKSYKPLFDDFLIIHANYAHMFIEARSALFQAAPGSTDPAEVIAQVKDYLTAQRAEYDGLRTKLRALSQAIVVKTEDLDERRFLWAIIVYFLQHEQPNKPYRTLDRQTHMLATQGKDAVIDTPSSFVLGKLKQESDPLKLANMLHALIADLAGYQSDICRAYALLHMKAYKLGA